MTHRRAILKAAAALPLAGMVKLARAKPRLLSTPIAGHFTAESVRLWLQAEDAAKAEVIYWPEAGKESDAKRSMVMLTASTAFSAVVTLGALTASTTYRYRISLDGTTSDTTGTFRTMPSPGAKPRDFRVYIGSCAYTEANSPSGNPYGDEFHIFDNMAAQMGADKLPHFMLWLGDNLYLRPKGRDKFVADFASAADMDARYRDVRAKPILQKLFAATHHYAIWDDHDFGPNNSYRNFPLKQDSLRLFKQYWPNPDMGSTALPGTWCKFTHQDAEFILLDDRFYRDDEEAPPSDTKAMFGPEQMTWLKASLKASKATFKIVAGGDQFLSENKNGVYSGWHSYKTERDDFLAWLAMEKIPGIVFLSGDRHNTQVFKLDIDGIPPIYEFCTSPLTSRLSKLSKTERANPRLVKELVLEKRNFGTLEFSGSASARKLIGRCFDSHGELQWTQELAAGKTGT